MHYSIKAFAQQVGLTEHTLRYYEKEQLLNPSRSDNGYRIYTQQDIERMQFILRLKETGMPIKEIRNYTALLTQGDHTLQERKMILQAHQKHIIQTINQWQAHQQKLEQKIAYYNARYKQHTGKDCP